MVNESVIEESIIALLQKEGYELLSDRIVATKSVNCPLL